ncbi:manganese efflux pump [Cohnella silvisoli]|uniref:Manganese efflux pump n=1 Tax=Cohnella silvisoli TaxID=2873699 RepID=A0ABV1L1T5_9BACL|nr:manganese efflux pump [Cohnella silvisoli]MCD9025893.1 manganese efflux pump [Cohnella silvisoli]
MHLISVLLIALVSNLDNLAIGISLGIRSTKIPVLSNGIIAGITMAGTYLSMNAGVFITGYISSRTTNLLGSAIIVLIGVWSIVNSLRLRTARSADSDDYEHGYGNRSSANADVFHKHVISIKESAGLSIALALNNLATGIGAGATGISPIWTTISVGVFSLLFIGFGSRFGFTLARSWLGSYSKIAAGILLILIGIYEMFI